MSETKTAFILGSIILLSIIVVYNLMKHNKSMKLGYNLLSSQPKSYKLSKFNDPIVGQLFHCDISIGGNIYNVIVDTGSYALNISNYKKTGTKLSKDNKFLVYGGNDISPEQCQSDASNPDMASEYIECAMIEWWKDKFVTDSDTIGSILYGGIPNILGLTKMTDNSLGTFLWDGNVSNLTLDFVNLTFNIDDTDTSGYDFVDRTFGAIQSTNEFYMYTPSSMSLNGTSLSQYYVIIDSGVSNMMMSSDLLQQVNEGDSLQIGFGKNISFNISVSDINTIGAVPYPVILLGNIHYDKYKLYLDGKKIGFKSPQTKLQSKSHYDNLKLSRNMSKYKSSMFKRF